jgi:hypothetical protein
MRPYLAQEKAWRVLESGPHTSQVSVTPLGCNHIIYECCHRTHLMKALCQKLLMVKLPSTPDGMGYIIG